MEYEKRVIKIFDYLKAINIENWLKYAHVPSILKYTGERSLTHCVYLSYQKGIFEAHYPVRQQLGLKLKINKNIAFFIL